MHNIRIIFEKKIKNSLIGVIGVWALGWIVVNYLNSALFHIREWMYYPVAGVLIGTISEFLFYYYYVPKKIQKEDHYGVLAHLFYIPLLSFLIFYRFGAPYEMYLEGILSALFWTFIFYGFYYIFLKREKEKSFKQEIEKEDTGE